MKPFLYAQPRHDDVDLLLRLYDPVELAILLDWMGIERPSQLASVALDWTSEGTALGNRISQDIAGHPIRLMRSLGGYADDQFGLWNAVARLLLSGIQARLPQWAMSMESGLLIFGRDIAPRRAAPVEPLPRYLFTVNWADSGPGFSWPEAYYATPLPGFDCLAITASQDSPDAYGYTDLALGTAPVDRPLADAAYPPLRRWWRMQARDWGQHRWEQLWDTGQIGATDILAWADEIWDEDTGEPLPDDPGDDGIHRLQQPR